MVRKLVITDLTRFQNNDKVCMAGIDTETGECIRPMPYLSFATYQKYEVLPGAVLEGDLERDESATPPHVEDHRLVGKWRVCDPVSSEAFLSLLEGSCFSKVSKGFGYDFPGGDRFLPVRPETMRSIITLRLDARRIEVVEDRFNPGRIKMHFSDGTTRFGFAPITDLGFYDYAMQHRNKSSLTRMNAFIHSQDRTFLRLGLSRPWTNPKDGRNGCWLQVNGIYTFPDYLDEIRSYSR